jgi:hypothetical protein
LRGGGTDDAPLLEIHSVDPPTGTVLLVKQLVTFDAETAGRNRDRRDSRRQRSEISATATPGGTEASQTIRRSTT